MDEIGICLRSMDLSAMDAVKIARMAEEIGFRSFWMTEEMSRASPPVLALVASATSRIKIGTAILNIFARTPMNTAMTAAALQEISGNRLLLGLGVGGPDITTRGHGVDFSNPVEKMAEYIEIVRKFLAAERVSFQGRFYRVDGLRLWIKTSHPTPVYLASLNPRMLMLAGTVADGIILNMFDPRAAPYVEEWIKKGLAHSKNPSRSFTKYSFVLTAVSHEPECISAMKRAAAFYLSSKPYRTILKKAGYEELVEDFVKTIESEGRDKAAEKIGLDLLDNVGLFCDENVSDKLERYRRAGIVPLVYPQPRPGKEFQDIETIVGTFAGL
ncbi:MAG: LLM class flavin-dependent oxidoreductase [Candidatus Caldarchaeum sp.]|nr:LLM class flavin-dependent oxidoreductase [Candidatus Caldarchaeum sp.]